MKKLLIVIVILGLNLVCNAQQNILSKISNPYLLSANSLSTLASINDYRNNNNIYPLETELINNKTVFKISYKPTSTSPAKLGIIDISFQLNQSGIKPIDERLNFYLEILQLDNHDSDVVKETIKSSTVNACYLIYKGGTSVFFYIFSPTNQNKIRGSIEFKYGELTDLQLQAFAKDFITKTVFK